MNTQKLARDQNSWLRRFLVTILCVIAVSLLAGEAGGRIKALILVGPDGRVHHWAETAAAIKESLEQDARYAVTTTTNLALLASKELSQYSVVVFQFNNPLPPETNALAKTNLLRFVEQGGGWSSFTSPAAPSRIGPNTAT